MRAVKNHMFESKLLSKMNLVFLLNKLLRIFIMQMLAHNFFYSHYPIDDMLRIHLPQNFFWVFRPSNGESLNDISMHRSKAVCIETLMHYEQKTDYSTKICKPRVFVEN